MQVRITQTYTDTRPYRTVREGDVLEVPEKRAQQLIDGGVAEPVVDKPKARATKTEKADEE